MKIRRKKTRTQKLVEKMPAYKQQHLAKYVAIADRIAGKISDVRDRYEK